MSNGLNVIPAANLALAFVPVFLVALVMWRWSAGTRALAWATARMIIQLILVGYVLTFIFDAGHVGIIAVVLAVMLASASWIALRPLRKRDRALYLRTLCAIAGGSLFTLVIVIFAVLRPDPWFEPRTLIPIAGMIFSSAMNTVSLAAERYEFELQHGTNFDEARRNALNTALIPMINAFLAVGLVALPGMMTGQILSGVEPHVAVRYQIVVMCMTFGAAGLAAIGFLTLAGRRELQLAK